MAEREYDDRTCIILTRIKNSEIGLIVDTVSEVLNIPEKDIDPPPAFSSTSVQDKYVNGLGKIGEEVKILLDVEKLLHEHEVAQIQESTEN
jgi:purine-binding chemotaxis protein CheW